MCLFAYIVVKWDSTTIAHRRSVDARMDMFMGVLVSYLLLKTVHINREQSTEQDGVI